MEATTMIPCLSESCVLVTMKEAVSFPSLSQVTKDTAGDPQTCICTARSAPPRVLVLQPQVFLLPAPAATTAKPAWYKLGELGAVLAHSGTGW